MQKTDPPNRLHPSDEPEMSTRSTPEVDEKILAAADSSDTQPPLVNVATPEGLGDLFQIDSFGERKDRHRPLLQIMLIVIAGFMIMLVLLSSILGLLTSGDEIAVGVLCLGSLAALGALLAQRSQTAGYFLILGIMLALLVRSWLNINDISNLFFNYFTVVGSVVLAGLVIHEMAPFVVTGVAIVGFGFIFWQTGTANPGQVSSLIQIFIGGVGFYTIMAVMSWFNARTIRRAMSRMRWQNGQLLQVNRRLESNISLNSKVGDTISQLASELLNISQEQSDRSYLQAQAVVVVTSTLEELSATARQVAEVADNVYSATEQALHTAETGGKAVGFGIDSVATLTDQVETISRIANELGTKSRRISEIVETITELAEETNLLALNATIEAAGAGEYGRRFAVVAQEVQFLATRSRAASRDVQSILGQIRISINNTLKATNEGLNEAQRMSEVASQAGEALEQIIENVEGTTYLARQINLTTQQQRTATDQAVEMIRQLAGSSREASVRSQRLILASDRLNQTAASLRRDQLKKAET